LLQARAVTAEIAVKAARESRFVDVPRELGPSSGISGP
jgi:hypothetical protein